MENVLIDLIRSSPWLMRMLGAVRDESLPDAWIGAGVLRDLVWGERYGPGFLPEAKNQAAVHTWYPRKFGGSAVEPLTSIHDAVGSWPETATAVAVRLTMDSMIEVCAPLGLDDLLNGIWRRNPRRISVPQSLARLARHDPTTRWPQLTVVPPA